MKSLNVVMLLFLGAGSAAAQSLPNLSDSPGVVVLKHSWKKINYHPNLDVNRSTQVADSERLRTTIITEQARPPRNEPFRPAGRIDVKTPQTEALGRTWAAYNYKIKVKNTGTKTITRVDWILVFFHPTTILELGGERFRRWTRIEPGRIKDLSIESGPPPDAVLDVKQAGKANQEKPLEQVILTRIEYADGTGWTRVFKRR